MDIIISANEDVLHMIREIPIDEEGKVDADSFRSLALKIANGRIENNEI